MQKDVIYIDIDDDITAIIGKIKKSKQQIVALVPPKRNGAMQSAVNLRLLEKMAKNAHKNVVIVTHNPALTALAATAKIPVAKTLESKPEIVKIETESKNDKDEVIEGGDLPIGDHARLKEADNAVTEPIIKVHNNTIDEAVDTIEESELSALDNPNESEPVKKSKNNKLKVPDFGSFRKKLILAIIGLLILIPAIVWATIFAPAARIIITAKTSPQTINETVTLSTTLPTDVSKNILHVVEQKISDKPLSVDFTATGTADVGNKATGTINIKNCGTEHTLKSGTIFRSDSNALLFKSLAEVVIKSGSGKSDCINLSSHPGASSTTIQVVADQSGTAYNIDADTFNKSTSISQYIGVYASSSDAMKGGTTKISTVVTADDVQKAKEQLIALSTSSAQDQLKSLFTDQQAYILESFNIDRKDATSEPAVGDDAAGTSPKLTSLTTFTMYGINKSDLNAFLDSKLAGYLSSNQNQKIYNNGTDSIKFNTFVKNDTSFSVGLSTIAKVGPEVKESDVKMLAAGKRYGDVQSALESIPGVDSADTKFSYFWVSMVPNDQNKITVEFNVDGSN
jgi:hypothetical protein